jgi:hypothetical protein
VDTELGTLLNVADQLLKGWSEAGQVNYLNFQYPKPRTYPFGTVPVREADKSTKRESFLYNWNTDGAAYRQMINGLDVVVPQRTGALPVIYGHPENRPRNLENVAYDYFATSGDTSLVRVVQYTFLYQVFREFDVSAAPPPISPRYLLFAANLKEARRRQLRLVMSDLSSDDLNNSLRAYWNKSGDRITDDEFVKLGLSRQEAIEKAINLAIAMAAALREGQAASNGQLSDALAEIVSNFRSTTELTTKEQQVLRSAERIIASTLSNRLAEAILQNEAQVLRGSGIMAVAAERLGSWDLLNASAGPDHSWNHTAYVVESVGTGAGIGGHNIDAPVLRFSNSAAQAKGKISVARDATGQLVVTHAPSDADRVRDIARQIGTRKELSKERIEAEVNAALKNTPPDPPVPFASIRPMKSIAAAKSTEFKFLDPSESAYRVRPLRANEQQLMSALKATNEQAIVFEQLPDGSFVMTRTGSAEALHVASVTAATDALANGLLVSAGGRSPVTVLVKGVPAAKTEAMLSQIQSSLRRYPKETVQHVLSAEADGALLVPRPTLLNARIAHNGIRVERGAVKVEQVKSGVYEGYSRVEVPITIQAETPLLWRIVFFVKDLTNASRERLLNKIESVIATLKGPTSVADVNFAVRQQLQADLTELGVAAVLLRANSEPTGKVHNVIIGAHPVRRAYVG